jgi:glycosyltransferase involved in cell wall biosynthesis
MSLTVVVPFFNEENTLLESVTRLVNCKIASEIFLVNDGSTDKSLELAKMLSSQNNNITVFDKSKNTGKGSCIKFILNEVGSDYLLVHDADLEQDPKDIKNLYNLSLLNPETLITGSRILGDLKRDRKYSLYTFANRFLSAIFSLLYNYKVSDISTGYIVIPIKFLRKIKLQEEGFGFEIEIISKFLKYNKSLIEYPISYNGRKYSDGKKIKIKDGLNIFLKIFKYKFFN